MWMLGAARQSPTARGVGNIKERISRLEKYESWSNCTPLNVKDIVSPALWEQYYALQEDILLKMRDAQKLALEIAQEIKLHVRQRAELDSTRRG
jgi:hypothetical protein